MLKLLIAACVLSLAAQCSTVNAAKIYRADTKNCDVVVSGEINVNDTDTLRSILYPTKDASTGDPEPLTIEKPQANRIRSQEQVQLCLDGPGGNFAEAIKMVKLILTYSRSNGYSGLMTVVEAQKVCESACAIVFLAGRKHVGDGNIETLRFMHPTAKVGFHGPYNVGDTPETSNPTLIASAQQKGVLVVADLLDLDDKLFPRALLKTFLRIPGKSYYYISTIDDIGKWDIGLFDYKQPQISNMDQVSRLCNNQSDWKSAGTVEWFDPNESDLSAHDDKSIDEVTKKLAATTVAPALGTTWISFGGYGSEGNEACSVRIIRNKSDFISVRIHSNTDSPEEFLLSPEAIHLQDEDGVPLWQFYPPETKLVDLQPATNSRIFFAKYSDPKPDNTEGTWRLNGLKVKISVAGDQWVVRADKGNGSKAKPGAVLFKGQQSHTTVTGVATLIDEACNAVPVSGKIDNNRKFGLKGSTATPRGCRLDFTFQPDLTVY